jgi:hypothetical protein
MDWQKRLAGKVTENPEIKRLEGEPDAKVCPTAEDVPVVEAVFTQPCQCWQNRISDCFLQEDKDAVLDNLKRNMVEETTKVSPRCRQV